MMEGGNRCILNGTNARSLTGSGAKQIDKGRSEWRCVHAAIDPGRA